MAAPRTPTGLGTRGARTWRDLHGQYDFGPAELPVVHELCRLLDVADRLADVLATDGVTALGSTGQTRVHPAVGELRSTQLAITKLAGSLDLPDPDPESKQQTPEQRHRSDAARKAAHARWGTHGPVTA